MEFQIEFTFINYFTTTIKGRVELCFCVYSVYICVCVLLIELELTIFQSKLVKQERKLTFSRL